MLPTGVNRVRSPLGDILLTYEYNYIYKLRWAPDERPNTWRTYPPLITYFSGQWPADVALPPITDLPGTPFQQAVWAYLTTLKWGQQTTYAAIAQALNRPQAYRAVATAVARNPIMIFIPCHRVIRTSGQLGDYAGGSERKQVLCDHESV